MERRTTLPEVEPTGQFRNKHLTDGAERMLSNWRKIMQITGESGRNAELLRSLKQSIEDLEDGNDKVISKCLLILLAAVEVGADVDRIVEYTGYPREFIEAVSQRMRAADLWMGELVDDLGLWDQENNLSSEFYFHALIAKGELVRDWPRNGRYRYIDVATGEVVGDWRLPVQ
jgi:hypothetical protein